MYVSTIKLIGRAEKRQEILLTIEGIQEQVRRSEGCQSALCYQDLQNDNIFCLINEWETQKGLDEYLQSKLFFALLGIKTILIETPEIRIMTEEFTYKCKETEGVQVQ